MFPERSMERSTIEELVYKSCMLLDEKDYKGYLALCDDDFRYTITAHSPELRRDMVWLDHDRKGLETLFTQLPRHNSEHSPLTRNATVYSVAIEDSGEAANVVTALQVFKTELDGGITALYAVGKYLDRVSLANGTVKLARRTVKLDTRMLGIGYHIPF
jgi:methanesulfonate monooxygenase small subunit